MATISLGDDLLAVLPGAYPAVDDQVRELVILELYRRRTISSGKAAELLRMDREAFVQHAGRLGIPYLDLDDLELAREIGAADDLP